MLHFNYRITSRLGVRRDLVHKIRTTFKASRIWIQVLTNIIRQRSPKCQTCKIRALLEGSLFRGTELMWNPFCSQIRPGLDNKPTGMGWGVRDLWATGFSLIALQLPRQIQTCQVRLEPLRSKPLVCHNLRYPGLVIRLRPTKICSRKMEAHLLEAWLSTSRQEVRLWTTSTQETTWWTCWQLLAMLTNCSAFIIVKRLRVYIEILWRLNREKLAGSWAKLVDVSTSSKCTRKRAKLSRKCERFSRTAWKVSNITAPACGT